MEVGGARVAVALYSPSSILYRPAQAYHVWGQNSGPYRALTCTPWSRALSY